MKLKLTRVLARKVETWLRDHGCSCPKCQAAANLLEPIELSRRATFVESQVSLFPSVSERYLMHEVRSRCLRCGFDQNILPLEIAGIVVEDDGRPS
jgi:hypothetical protein